jgi:urea carboxylase
MTVAVGFFVGLPLMLPVDPRQRMQSPKMNPSRIHTPEGQVGWGGSCMALYNVESPGGYMNIGLSIPCADILGFKNSYSAEKPWLVEDFDQVIFHEVSEDEYDKMMAIFHSGRYVYEYEDGEFDMAEHNRLLDGTKDEVAKMRKDQSQAQAELSKKEQALLDKLNAEKAAGKVSMDTIDELLNDPAITAIEAPLNANVWKVQVSEGDSVKDGQVVVILEAMKLEINVNAEATAKVEKMIVKAGDVIEAGKPLMLLRK